MDSIKIQNVFAYLNIYLYSLAICRCSSMLFCFYSARKIDRKWAPSPGPSSCIHRPATPNFQGVATLRRKFRSMSVQLHARFPLPAAMSREKPGGKTIQKSGITNGKLCTQYFSLFHFFSVFFFLFFFVFGIGCVYLTNIKHIFTPDDDAIIIVLIVFAGESKVQTSINKNNILLG